VFEFKKKISARRLAASFEGQNFNDIDELTRTWAQVDLNSLRHNVRIIRGQLKNGAGLLAVVKANAYGHGAIQVAKAALESGAMYLGVASVQQGCELREAGITEPILLLGPCTSEEMRPGIEASLTFSVSSKDEISALADRSRAVNQGIRRGKKTRVHLLVDTGMGRSGFAPAEVWPAGEVVLAEKTLELEGIFTHFSAAEEPDPNATKAQISDFKKLLSGFDSRRVHFKIRHAANSAGTVFFPEAQLDMVRCGAILHGMRPWTAGRDQLELRPTLSLYTRIVHLGRREAGWPVGYSSKFRCPRESVLATLPIGYSDGYRRSLTGRGEAILRGRRVPVVGAVSMDYIVADVTEIANSDPKPLCEGEVVTLIGGEDQNRITVEEWAEYSGTIPYVVTTQLNASVKRIYDGLPDSLENKTVENVQFKTEVSAAEFNQIDEPAKMRFAAGG
jgi:alanine racemase